MSVLKIVSGGKHSCPAEHVFNAMRLSETFEFTMGYWEYLYVL